MSSDPPTIQDVLQVYGRAAETNCEGPQHRASASSKAIRNSNERQRGATNTDSSRLDVWWNGEVDASNLRQVAVRPNHQQNNNVQKQPKTELNRRKERDARSPQEVVNSSAWGAGVAALRHQRPARIAPRSLSGTNTKQRDHGQKQNAHVNVSDLPPLCVMVVGVVLDSRRCAERVWRSVLAIIIPTPFISRGRGPASGVVEGDSDLTLRPRFLPSLLTPCISPLRGRICKIA